MYRLLLATLLFLFPLALTIWDIEDKIGTRAPSLGPYLAWIPWISFGLLALFIVVVVVESLSLVVQAIYRLQPSTLANMTSLVARADDIPVIVDIAKSTMGDRITIENTLKLYNHNKRCIRKVVDTRSNQIVGYFCVLPLTINGEKRVMDRDLISNDLDVQNFAKNFRRGMPVYIGSMAATTTRGRAATLELAKVTLANMEITKAFTRPVTKDGVRLVKRFGFEPVSEFDKLISNVYVMKVREPF